MSYSVSGLFKDIAKTQLADKVKSETLSNPDIPALGKRNASSSAISIPLFRDQAHNALKLRSYPSNGMALLPRNDIYKDPRRDAFAMDGAIDPAIIRNQTNPINEAMPVYNDSTLMGGSDKSMEEAKDSMDLVRRARESYSNYVNRFDIQPAQNTPSSSSSVYGSAYKPQLAAKIGYTPPAYNANYDRTGETGDIFTTRPVNYNDGQATVGGRGVQG